MVVWKPMRRMRWEATWKEGGGGGIEGRSGMGVVVRGQELMGREGAERWVGGGWVGEVECGR